MKRRSLDNEARLGEAIGFDLTPGSGNQHWPGGKGDGSHPHFQFELKETAGHRITVDERAIATIVRQARQLGKDPVLVLSAYDLPDPLPKDWCVVPVATFAWMLHIVNLYEQTSEKG